MQLGSFQYKIGKIHRSCFATENGADFRPQFEGSDCSEPNRDMGFNATKLQFMHKQAKT